MKTFSISPILAAIAALAFAGVGLCLPLHQAVAGKNQQKPVMRDHRDGVSKLTCVGPDCLKRYTENRARTTKNKANPMPVVRDHRGKPQVRSAPAGCYRPVPGCIHRSPRGGLPYGAKVRDHRGSRVVPKEDPRPR